MGPREPTFEAEQLEIALFKTLTKIKNTLRYNIEMSKSILVPMNPSSLTRQFDINIRSQDLLVISKSMDSGKQWEVETIFERNEQSSRPLYDARCTERPWRFEGASWPQDEELRTAIRQDIVEKVRGVLGAATEFPDISGLNKVLGSEDLRRVYAQPIAPRVQPVLHTPTTVLREKTMA